MTKGLKSIAIILGLLSFQEASWGICPQGFAYSPKERFESSAAVFVGKVIQATDGEVTFATQKILKGEHAKEISANYSRRKVPGDIGYQPPGFEECVGAWRGYNFEIGKEYLVYAEICSEKQECYNKDGLIIGPGSGTKEKKFAEKEIEALMSGKINACDFPFIKSKGADGKTTVYARGDDGQLIACK